MGISTVMLLAALGCRETPPGETPLPEGVESGEWLLPGAGATWEKTRLLALLAYPLEADPASLGIELNGTDHTAAFLPSGLFSRRWSERAADDAETGDDPDGGPGGGVSRRVQAVLGPEHLRPGTNHLAATFRTAAGEQTREVNFSYRPAGRKIVCRVLRENASGWDREAGARIVIQPLAGAPEVDLSAGDDSGWLQWPEPRRHPFALARGGEAIFHLPEGAYRAVATAGLRHEIDEWLIPERGEATHTFRLARGPDLPAMTAVDFHVHASPSVDSIVPMAEQLHAFMAGGVDVLVASDHGQVTDFAPLIATLPGAAGRIRAVSGVETSIRRRGGGSFGHWNIWPLHPDPGAPPTRPGQGSGGGALRPPVASSAQEMESRGSVPALYSAYRRQARALAAGAGEPDAPEAVIQLNHPRGIQHNPKLRTISRTHDYFNVVGWTPGEAPPASLRKPGAGGLAALDFDVLEIWNRSSRRLYEEVRGDWFRLLDAGIVRTATANSDTHTVAPGLAGFPVNLVLDAGESSADLVNAVRAGRVVGTDGPVPLLTVQSRSGSSGPGGLLAAAGGRVVIRVEVRAPSWVPRGEIRVWTNGGRILTRGPGPVLRFEARLDRDSWLVAEVGDLEGVPEETTQPGLYGLLVPRGLAVGFTNAVRVDVDLDGAFDPEP